MSQHDYIISDAVGSVFLSDLNSNLQAIVTDNSGTTEPTVTYANMVWADTSTSPPTIKRRNALNTAWVSENDMSGNVTISTNNSSAALTITQDGTGNCLVVNDQPGDSSPFVIGNAGNVCIGGSAVSSQNFRLSKNLTGNTTVYGFVSQQTILSDVTNAATLNYSGLLTQAASFTLPIVKHFSANQDSIGAGSTVTTQYGFIAEASLTGATNNYGFYGNIASASGRYNFYASGTAPNYYAGDVRTNTTITEATTVTNSNSSTTLTAANLLGHIVSGTPAAGINYTLPTGTDLDTAFQNLSNNQAFNWSVINLAAATHTITLLANTAHTIVGNAVVQANTSGTFRTRKTAANTFVTYRIS